MLLWRWSLQVSEEPGEESWTRAGDKAELLAQASPRHPSSLADDLSRCAALRRSERGCCGAGVGVWGVAVWSDCGGGDDRQDGDRIQGAYTHAFWWAMACLMSVQRGGLEPEPEPEPELPSAPTQLNSRRCGAVLCVRSRPRVPMVLRPHDTPRRRRPSHATLRLQWCAAPHALGEFSWAVVAVRISFKFWQPGNPVRRWQARGRRSSTWRA